MSLCVNIAFASTGLRKRGRVESSSCSRKSADKLAANRSTKGTASASGTVRGKLINAFFCTGGLIYM